MENDEYKKTIKLNVWMTEPQYEAVRDISYVLNMSISQFIREAIEEKIKEYIE